MSPFSTVSPCSPFGSVSPLSPFPPCIPCSPVSPDYDWNEFLLFWILIFCRRQSCILVYNYVWIRNADIRGIFCVAFLKIHTKSDYNCSYHHYSYRVYAFYECRLHFTKEYCFTEYHRFPDLLFAGSIQYDDDCHVK